MMKKFQLLTALMLLVSVSLWAEEPPRFNVSESATNPMENGSISIPDQSNIVGSTVTVYCKPEIGYGMSRGVYYATRNANGGLSAPMLAVNKSTYPDDRGNRTQRFQFEMPAADVEVWAYFVPLRTMKIHQSKDAKSKLVPRYGLVKEEDDYALVQNVPTKPIILKSVPDTVRNDDGSIKMVYELVDAEITNINPSYCFKSADSIVIYMPNSADDVHVTPIFGQQNYKFDIKGDTTYVKVAFGNEAPKAREEVDVILTSAAGYIPKDISFTGCKSSWLKEKPVRLSDGKWKTVYRCKFDLQDVTLFVNHERVYSFSVNDTKDTKRVKTYIPEMIAGYPGVARDGQQIPVVFMMPKSYSVKYNVKGLATKPLPYHNALRNSFADEGLNGWTDETPDNGNRLPVAVFTDSIGNKYWRTSGINKMSQTVDISTYAFPENTKKNGRLNVAAIASINPYGAYTARVSIVTGGNGKSESLVVADIPGKVQDWVTELKVGTVDATATELKLLVEGQADDENKRSYTGPMFDDLCLLLPTEEQSIKNENVLIFTMKDKDVTIDYTPEGEQGTMSIVKTDHASLTLYNTITKEEGETIKVMTDDVITIKGKADDGYAVYSLSLAPPTQESSARVAAGAEYDDFEDFEDFDESEIIDPVSIDFVANETTFRYTMQNSDNLAVTPTVDKQKVMLKNYFGGKITVDKEFAKKGETVVVTVKTRPGNQLKRISTSPANAVQFKEEQVDKATGEGTYSFVMPASYITLKGEFIVPITTAQRLDSISQQLGTFRLDADLDLGSEWNNKSITLIGDFDGNGHHIKYAGNSSLFHIVDTTASVRHLYVDANVKGPKIGAGSDDYKGGICSYNYGIIEDCEVSGAVKNERPASTVGAIAGLNAGNMSKGNIAYCHVLCEGLEGPTVYGIARQSKGSVIKDNVFSGMFVAGESRTYMVSNDMDSVTIERNYYVSNTGNARATVCSGVSATTPDMITDLIKNAPQDNTVYVASLKSKYVGGYTIQFSLPENVNLVNSSTEQANAGTLITASVSVTGNNHLKSITISKTDGTDAQECTFTDDMESVYSFSFTMPGHDVLISFQTEVGRNIFTASQFASIDDQKGIYYLQRDIELNNWEKSVNLDGTFHGNGHTIKFHEEGTTKGLFYRLRAGALLEGLRVDGVIETSENCAGLVYENKGTIRNCHFYGQIVRLQGKRPKKNRIAAIVYKNDDEGKVEYCSAAGELTNTGNQDPVDKCPLYGISDASKVTNCVWISNKETNDTYRQKAQSALNDYPVFAQGILDRIDARIITGSNSQTVTSGQTLAELTITDGEPFFCTSDVKVSRIVYKRKATKNLEPWVLPFAFTQMAGEGKFTYHEAIEKDKKPDLGPANELTLSNAPQAVSYDFNNPWLVSNDADGEERTYVLSNADGTPITLKATADHRVARYKSILDIGCFFAAYDTIPAKIVNDELMYVWNGTRQEFVLSNGSVALQPNRFYLQFYNSTSKKFVRYPETQWAKNEMATSSKASAPRRLAETLADGWQPVFLDPRQPQSITTRMLDYYDVAYLTDISGEVLNEDTESPLAAVSLVYMMADGRMDLPAALPLLVRAKRSDAEPLADAKAGAELDELLTQMMLEEEETDGDEDYEEDESEDFDIPHYWCASFDNRLDIWELPAPERYADLAEYGGMVFNDNYYDQSFVYATAGDTRSTSPMSYCITLLNAKTFELLPLMGDRVFVEFLVPAGATGIDTVKGEGFTVNDSESYNLNGQRLNSNYKGIIVQKGRKIYKR